MSRSYTRGKFRPKNPSKYKGNLDNIIFRSSYELKMFVRLDSAPNVLAWNSEEVVIPYFYTADQRWHRYFMDIWYRFKTPTGEIKERLVEIKPAKQVEPPKVQKRKTKKYIAEVLEWTKNQDKWKYAHKYAQAHGMSFHIFTEKELGIH